MKLYASGEDYLEAVLVLQRKQGMVAEQEACRIEHAISDTSFRKLKEKVQGTD